MRDLVVVLRRQDPNEHEGSLQFLHSNVMPQFGSGRASWQARVIRRKPSTRKAGEPLVNTLWSPNEYMYARNNLKAAADLPDY